MKKFLISFLGCFVLLSMLAAPAAAQHPVLQDGGSSAAPVELQPPSFTERADLSGLAAETSSPSKYSYTLSKVQWNWVDALPYAGGKALDFDWDHGKKGILVTLPFPFKFYENTYEQVTVLATGYLSFTPGQKWIAQSRIPDAAEPNNVIAPYWTPRYSETPVYMLSGGTAPGRYVTFEWPDVQTGSATFTFEAILYENGNIVFQYFTTDYYYTSIYPCASAGIENDTGRDAISSKPFCGFHPGFWYFTIGYFPNYQAVQFSRPKPAARLSASSYAGGFGAPGGMANIDIWIRNEGELGPDTFDLIPKTGLPTTLFKEDGVTPLADTDGDKQVDTGPVGQDAWVHIIAKMTLPASAATGKFYDGSLAVRSSLNPTRSVAVKLRAAVPASFAQQYVEKAGAAEQGHLDLIQPGGQQVIDMPNLKDAHMVTLADGRIVYTGTLNTCRSDCATSNYDNIMLAAINPDGSFDLDLTALTDSSTGSDYVREFSPVPAAAPDGTLAVASIRRERKKDEYSSTYFYWRQNIQVTLAKPGAGALNPGPTIDLTPDQPWGYSSNITDSAPPEYELRIGATGDNHFVVTWKEESYLVNKWVWNSYAVVIDSAGNMTLGKKQLTNDTESTTGLKDGSTLAALKNNQLLISWSKNGSIYRAVYDSSLTMLQPTLRVGSGFAPDAVQLPNGNIILAWEYTAGKQLSYERAIQYVVLDGSSLKVTRRGYLDHPGAYDNHSDVSVTQDGEGRAIITWQDYAQPKSLYYALLNSSGAVVTPTLTFRQNPLGIWTSPIGYGNTPFSPPAP